MGFFHLSVGSFGLLPMKPVQKAHSIVVTLQLHKNISLYISCVLLYLSVDFQPVNSAGSKLPFPTREERQALIPFFLPSLSPTMLGQEKPPVAHFALCSYISMYVRICAYMHMPMNVIVHARVCVITSSRCHTILLDYVSLTQ